MTMPDKQRDRIILATAGSSTKKDNINPKTPPKIKNITLQPSTALVAPKGVFFIMF